MDSPAGSPQPLAQKAFLPNRGCILSNCYLELPKKAETPVLCVHTGEGTQNQARCKVTIPGATNAPSVCGLRGPGRLVVCRTRAATSKVRGEVLQEEHPQSPAPSWRPKLGRPAWGWGDRPGLSQPLHSPTNPQALASAPTRPPRAQTRGLLGSWRTPVALCTLKAPHFPGPTAKPAGWRPPHAGTAPAARARPGRARAAGTQGSRARPGARGARGPTGLAPLVPGRPQPQPSQACGGTRAGRGCGSV